eukprot:TRINITY_DN20751_c0_g1_i1.p1 TRINITY_DN20751_c0_g1~~TRINITY_DN20751_c0_g1_i1.p1  ORF type:complete len:454 (+),score=113.58 TRINITY_DN20751_c0_g1_i1:31-1362(+)
MSAVPAVADLSLYGLFARLTEVERLKSVKSLSEEQTSLLESETAAKKAVAEQIQAAVSAGITSREKKLAQEFLQGQLKSIEDGSKGAEARRGKLTELLAGIQTASSIDEPAHVSRAKKDVAKAEKAFEEVSKKYEKWEKGKQMLNVDEIKTLKRAYEEGTKKIEKAKALVEEQLTLRAESAAAPLKDEPERGSAAMAVDNRAGRGKGGGKGGGRANAPAVSVRAGVSAGGGYPQPATGGPSAAAIRQAQMAAQVRAEAQAVQSSPAPAPKPRPTPSRPKQEEDVAVLSYACTCTAVAEHLRITADQARDLAESAKEFARHFDAATWELVKERSIAIEKANLDKQREKEKKKQAAALAKATERETAAVAGLAAAKPAAKPAAKAPASRSMPGATGPTPAAKPKAKSNAGPKRAAKPEGLDAYASGNRFGGFEDSDDDFWTPVKR